MTARISSLLAGLLIASSLASAQTPLNTHGAVLLDPVKGVVVIGRQSERKEERLARKNEFSIRPRETVRIGIARQMPLIFRYTWNGIVLTDTPDFTAAAAFANALTTLSTTTLFAKHASDVETRVAAANLANPVDKTALATRLNRVAAALKEVKFDDALVNEIAGIRNSLKFKVGAIPEMTVMSLKEDTLEAAKKRVNDPAMGWKTDEIAKAVDKAFKIVADARGKLLEGLEKDAAFLNDDPGLAETVTLLSSEEGNVRSWLKTAQEFRALLNDTGTELLFQADVSYDTVHNATVSVTLDYLPGAKDLAKSVFRNQGSGIDGEYTVVLQPHNPIALGAGLGSVFVFTRKADNDKEYSGWRPVAMLTLAPRSWMDYATVPRIEIGVTPESDQLGFYFGLGLKVAKAFTFVGGVTAQQRKIDGKTVFKRAPYLGFSVELAPKKQ